MVHRRVLATTSFFLRSEFTMLLGAKTLCPVATFMTLQFSIMARDCFDTLQNWSNQHSYVKVILAGRSNGELTDEEAAETSPTATKVL